ncbi:MAG: response regulator [Candidatus Gastranaerophilales bacterium]
MQSVTLIIDKRRELSTKYKKLLESKTNNVHITKTLISSMKFIKENEPDLIIISDSIDDNLSNYCKKIRALTYNMRPIIVALSKSAEIDDKLNVLENGADDFISEPVSSEEFVMRIKAHLRREYESNFDEKRILPNRKYSLRAIKRILNKKTQWACMLVSIDNFKDYREIYTELASDKLLQTYSAIIKSSLDLNDYLGVISDNEFLIITDASNAEILANYLTFAFESISTKFYSQQDIKRGFIMMQGDEIAGRRANFVHTTISVVTNEFMNYNEPIHLLTTLLTNQNLAKIPTRSNYFIERPQITAEDAISIKEFNNKILIIEDDEAMTLLLTTILNLQGHQVEVINKTRKVEIDNFSPALIILDAGNIETLNGIEICKTLKQNEKLLKTKIIMTSIFHDKELILSVGADLYLPKPYEVSNLIKWVEIFMKEFNN